MSRFVLVLLSATVLVACGDKEGPGLVDEDAGLDAGDVGDFEDAGGDAVSVPDMRPPRMRPDLGDCSPDRPDPPDEWYFDANCDGIDGDESDSVFVASYGVDDNPGTKALPKRTIRSAIATAVDEDKHWVLVGDGLHDAGFELAAGVSIAGGYGFGWERSDRFRTSLEGGNPAISGSQIRSKTILTGFEVEPRAVAKPRETVATILLVRSPGVRLRGLTIVGGVGGDGRDGADGVMGEEGDDGDDGDDGREDSGFIGCDEDGKPNVGAGGENGCEDARGGNGGEPGHENDGGMKGQDAAAGTAGGPPGADNEPGMKGDDGGRGSNGAPGSGGSADGGFFGWVWVGRDGEPGADGDPGTGGGGGGGGGGGSAMCDSWGGAGGGGGSGGCGGTGGGAGGYGGASVALFLYQSDVQIEGCTIIGGSGGRGGSGGDGGPGGRGGVGGNGGSREDDSGKGGDGGDGGVGGRGGQGGGGSGGPSYGIYSTDPLSVAPERIDFQIGAGGPGGLSASGDGRGADGVAEKKRIPSGGMMPAE